MKNNTENMACMPVCSMGDVRSLLDGGVKVWGLSLLSLSEYSEAVNHNKVEGALSVVVVCSGMVKIVMGNDKLSLHGNDFFLINIPSRVTEFRCSKACVGYVATFSTEFLSNADVDIKDVLVWQTTLCRLPRLTLSLQDIEQLNSVVVALCQMKCSELDKCSERVIKTLFLSLFYLFIAVSRPLAVGEQSTMHKPLRSEELFSEFVALLGRECERERSVEYYANALNITPKYLSMVCRAQTSKNASKIIDEAVICRAKGLLMQSGLSVQEVAEKMNFASQSFFGKYFKQRVGIAPSRYRLRKF